MRLIMSKWKKFHSTYSPVDISKANSGNANITGDWFREARQSRMTVNGIPIGTIAKDYNGFEKESDVETFFDEVILKDFPSTNTSKKQGIVNFLKTTFHQGGFMNPVSSALAVSMKEYSEQDKKEMPYATIRKPELIINIVTTSHGFKVQEFVKVKECLLSEAFIKEHKLDQANPAIDRAYPVMAADSGNQYILEAQGTINIDFSDKSNKPTVNVESNTISYGNSILSKKMDKRDFGQIIVDFLKRLVGLNQVKDIAPQVELNSNEVKPDSEPSAHSPRAT